VALEQTLGFMGFGNMGRAIAGGLIETGVVSQRHIVVRDIDPAKCEDAERLGVNVAASTEELARQSNILVLAVKPQNMQEALEEIKPGLAPDMLVISIAAGISIGYLQERLGANVRVVRVMPNTPALVRAGAAGFALSANATEADAKTARAVFEAVGIVEEVPEEAIDAVTALSGSGPAYFFNMVEALVAAASSQGIERSQAARLAAQTLYGAGRLLVESGESPATLRERVTSKGGTTEAALAAFQEKGFAAVIAAGVAAAAARSKELGK